MVLEIASLVAGADQKKLSNTLKSYLNKSVVNCRAISAVDMVFVELAIKVTARSTYDSVAVGADELLAV